jgi:FlaA1/EpsC-like NDP-sugar epimerase
VDIEIKFIGIRPGEKLYEELYLDQEQLTRTRHPKIFEGRHGTTPPPDFTARIQHLLAAAMADDSAVVRGQLHALVPQYKPGTLETDGAGLSATYVGHLATAPGEAVTAPAAAGSASGT